MKMPRIMLEKQLIQSRTLMNLVSKRLNQNIKMSRTIPMKDMRMFEAKQKDKKETFNKRSETQNNRPRAKLNHLRKE
jgi:hypothetical protein